MRMIRYVSALYIKYFFIIAFALSLLFAGLDYLQHAGDLNGFNLKLLYLYYRASYAIDLLFPLVLIFAMIVTKIRLIHSNALVSFYALGYSKKRILVPFGLVSALLTLIYIGLHFTAFVNADYYAKAILQHKKGMEIKKSLFLKYDNSFIYIGRLVPALKKAEDIRVFQMEQNDARTIIYGKSAFFDGKKWRLKDVKIVRKPAITHLGGEGLKIERKKEYVTLDGFRPKILVSVFEGKQFYTVQAAYDAIELLLDQGVDTAKIRNKLYNMVFTPFFAVFLVIIFFLYIPPYARSLNLILLGFVLTGTSLAIWGTIFVLYRIARSGMIYPEVATFLPIGLLGALTLYAFLFKTNRF